MSSDSDSDDCGRLSPLLNINPSLVLTKTKQKSVQDLLNESRSLIEDLKIVKSTFVPLIKIEPESEEILKDHGQTKSKSEVQNLNKLVNNAQVLCDSQKIFGKSGYLQFFSLKDVILNEYYYYIPDEKLSRPEKILLSCSPENLHTSFSHALQGFSVSSFSDLNPIVHYALGIVCLHEEIAVVDKCAKFLNKMLREHFNVSSISFSSEEMFHILFNYGVDIQNSPIFKFLPVKSRRVIKKVLTKDTKKMPQYWKHNLQSVLCCLSNVFKYCKFNKIDLSKIFFYLLIMSVDETLRAHFTNLELKICLCNVLLSFSDEVWPFCVTWMKSTLMSQTINLPADQKWGLIFLMTQAIPNTISRGKQLRTQLAFLSIMHLCGTVDLEDPSEYPEESWVVPKFLDSLENFPHIPSHLQKICIDFIDIFLAHYEFSSKDEYTNVCKAVKICEHSVTKGKWEINFESNEMTLALQLVKIYSVLKMMPNKYMGLKEDSVDDVDDQIVTNISTAENNTEESYPLLKPPRPEKNANSKIKQAKSAFQDPQFETDSDISDNLKIEELTPKKRREPTQMDESNKKQKVTKPASPCSMKSQPTKPASHKRHSLEEKLFFNLIIEGHSKDFPEDFENNHAKCWILMILEKIKILKYCKIFSIKLEHSL